MARSDCAQTMEFYNREQFAKWKFDSVVVLFGNNKPIIVIRRVKKIPKKCLNHYHTKKYKSPH